MMTHMDSNERHNDRQIATRSIEVEAEVVDKWWRREPDPDSRFKQPLMTSLGEPMSYAEWSSMTSRERIRAKMEQPDDDSPLIPGTV